MVVFENLIKRLEKVKRAVPYLVEEIAKDESIQNTIIDLNQNQMYDGERADGSDISPSYVDRTIKYKKKRGDPYDRVTLLNFGDFYQEMKNVYSSEGITITSTDKKKDKLVKKYGEGIFGLNEVNLQKVRVDFFELLRYKIMSRYFNGN
jgi:hypothetical protein